MYNKIFVLMAIATARILIWFRYRIELVGLEKIKAKGREKILFLPNHPAFIDPIIVASRLLIPFKVRPLADMDQVDRPVIGEICRRINTLLVPSISKRGASQAAAVRKVVDACVSALQNGDSLMVYPSGHTMRQRYENLGGASAVETMVKQVPDVRIVLVRTTGLWGSSFSRADGHEPSVGTIMKKAIGRILSSFIFFVPKRKVRIEFVEPDDFPREANRATINRYLEKFYNEVSPPRTYVPFTIWERGKTRTLPEPKMTHVKGNPSRVPRAIRELVWDYLTETVGVSRATDAADLSRDLGMDSLAKAGLIVWINKEFGYEVADVDSINTVGDAMLAACGQAASAGERELAPVDEKWKTDIPTPLGIENMADKNICEAFIEKARANADKVIVADQNSGIKTYRELILGIYAVKGEIEKIPGNYAGIMMPASVGAALLYMAALFAGKTPVMINWTTGKRNLMLALESLGVEKIITSKLLIEKLAGRGIELGELTEKFMFVEDVKEKLSLGTKLKAAFKSKFTRWGDLAKVKPQENAVVLFTSGSESVPKAVPLTHRNLMSNISAAVNVYESDKIHCMIGMLPPFHSFGIMVNVLFCLLNGKRVVYYPDPTDSAMLGKIIEAYGCTMLVGTPTFLQGVVSSCSAEQLKTLKFVVSGAEACSEQVYELVDKVCPQTVIVEGYGITEMSPIAACNRQWDARPRTIGKVLEGMESVIVNPETMEAVEAGTRGMLLVRGPNMFGGYLNYDGPSPFVEYDGKKWYRTGDLVTAADDGHMTFQGRLKRFVKIGGEMISLPAIEQALGGVFSDDDIDGPALAICADESGESVNLVLFTVMDISREQANEAIRASGLSGLHNIRRVETIEEIPVLGTGKTDYRTLQGKLNEGESNQ